jgi:AraC family transcriptional regulator
VALGQPRIVDHGRLIIGGMSRRYTPATISKVNEQWFEIQSHLASATGRVGSEAYGLWFNVLAGGGEFQYLSGVAFTEFAPIATQFHRAIVAPLRYAVFTHNGPATELRGTVDAILSQWLPNSGQELARVPNAPDFIEVYSQQFNETGQGPIEIWLPIKKK